MNSVLYSLLITHYSIPSCHRANCPIHSFFIRPFAANHTPHIMHIAEVPGQPNGPVKDRIVIYSIGGINSINIINSIDNMIDSKIA
jgi:hypothetical protein